MGTSVPRKNSRPPGVVDVHVREHDRLDVLDPEAGRPERGVEVLLGLVAGDREPLPDDRRP